MLQPAFWYFGYQAVEPVTSRPVGMDFAGGSKEQFVLTEV